MLRNRVALAALLVVALEVWLWALFLAKEEPAQRFSFQAALGGKGFATVPFELLEDKLTKGRFQASFELAAGSERLSSIGIQFVTFGGPARTFDAELRLGTCLAAQTQVVIRDNEFLAFDLAPACRARDHLSPTPRVDLRLTADPGAETHRLGFWARRGRANPTGPHLRLLYTPSAQAETYFPLGYTEQASEAPPMPRLQKMAWLWGFADHWIWFGATINALFLVGIGLLGALLFSRSGPMRPSWAVATAFSGCLATLGVAWALVIPPFQAPDEPDHYLSFVTSQATGRSVADIETFARRIHFERIKFDPHQRFGAADTLQGYPKAWGSHIAPPNPALRAPAAAWLWSLFSKVQPGTASVAAEVLSLRVLNIVTVALAAGLAAGLAGCSPVGIGALLWFFALPNLLFFTMAINTYVVLVMGCVVVATALYALEAGCFAGSGQHVARKALPWSLLWWSLLCCGLALLISGGEAGTAYAAAACGLIVLSQPRLGAQLAGWVVAPGVFWLTLQLAPEYQVFKRPGVSEAFRLWTLTALPVGAGFWWLHRQLAKRRLPAEVLTAFKVIAALGCFLYLYVSLVFVQDGLHNIEAQPKISAPTYMWDAVKTLVLSAGLGTPDYYTAETFWSPYGWLEAMWHPALTKALQMITLTGVALWFADQLRGQGNTPPAINKPLFAVAKLIVLLGLVAALAYGYHSARVNLHGRYLVGFYLFLFVYAARGWATVLSRQAEPLAPARCPTTHRSASLSAGALVIFACTTLAAVHFVAHRYF